MTHANDIPGLLEAMARNAEMTYNRGDESVGVPAGWECVAFNAEDALFDYMKANPSEAMAELFLLIGDYQGELTMLFLAVNSTDGYDTLTDMRNTMLKRFEEAVKHCYNISQDQVHARATEIAIDYYGSIAA